MGFGADRVERHITVGAPLALAALLGVLLAGAAPAYAEDVSVAVAANFTTPAKEIAEAFRAETGQNITLSFGASGQFYTQITQGAPFDILLSADSIRPKKAEDEGYGVPGTRFTYAIGKLVLWSYDPTFVDSAGKVLAGGNFTHLAVANPDAAPYGVAAIEALKALGLYDSLAPKIVKGESIGQTYQFVATGSAELGFVALSQVINLDKGSSWVVPERLYSPILQDAILLKPGEKNQTAKDFFAYLKGAKAGEIIHRYGYTTMAGT